MPVTSAITNALIKNKKTLIGTIIGFSIAKANEIPVKKIYTTVKNSRADKDIVTYVNTLM